MKCIGKDTLKVLKTPRQLLDFQLPAFHTEFIFSCKNGTDVWSKVIFVGTICKYVASFWSDMAWSIYTQKSTK